MLKSLPSPYNAVVLGVPGGIGGAIYEKLSSDSNCEHAFAFSRQTDPAIDYARPETLKAAAKHVEGICGEVHLLIIATGILTAPDGSPPEKAFSHLSGSTMQDMFAVNATGPALALQALMPLLDRKYRTLTATLSARVGSVGDNKLGGWISYRASKAALNQITHTAAIELSRKNRQAVCVALHPGTIETDLSKPYAKNRFTHSTDACAENLLSVLDDLAPEASGGFYDYAGVEIAW